MLVQATISGIGSRTVGLHVSGTLMTTWHRIVERESVEFSINGSVSYQLGFLAFIYIWRHNLDAHGRRSRG